MLVFEITFYFPRYGQLKKIHQNKLDLLKKNIIFIKHKKGITAIRVLIISKTYYKTCAYFTFYTDFAHCAPPPLHLFKFGEGGTVPCFFMLLFSVILSSFFLTFFPTFFPYFIVVSLFQMAAMPFPCNGLMLWCVNLP